MGERVLKSMQAAPKEHHDLGESRKDEEPMLKAYRQYEGGRARKAVKSADAIETGSSDFDKAVQNAEVSEIETKPQEKTVWSLGDNEDSETQLGETQSDPKPAEKITSAAVQSEVKVMEHQEKEDDFDDFVAKQQAEFDKQGTSESQEAVFSSMKRKFKAFLSKIGESSMDPDDSSTEKQTSNDDVNKADDTNKDEDGSAVSEDDGSGAPDQMDVPSTPEEAEALNPALLDDTDPSSERATVLRRLLWIPRGSHFRRQRLPSITRMSRPL